MEGTAIDRLQALLYGGDPEKNAELIKGLEDFIRCNPTGQNQFWEFCQKASVDEREKLRHKASYLFNAD